MRGQIIALLALAGLVAGCGSEVPTPSLTSSTTATTPAATPVAAPPPVLIVSNVVDGDTVDLSDGRRVRLLGIDSPERGECGFEEATKFARDTLLGQGVVAAGDPTQEVKDFHGRDLLYLEPLPGRVDYSVSIANAGWAEHYVFEGKPVQKASAIGNAETMAKHRKLGIWGSLCVKPTPSPTPSPKPQPAPAPKNDDDDARRPAPPRDNGGGGGGSTYYKNCSAARAAGAAPVTRGEPGYGKHLDRDGDGVGCE